MVSTRAVHRARLDQSPPKEEKRPHLARPYRRVDCPYLVPGHGPGTTQRGPSCHSISSTTTPSLPGSMAKRALAHALLTSNPTFENWRQCGRCRQSVVARRKDVAAFGGEHACVMATAVWEILQNEMAKCRRDQFPRLVWHIGPCLRLRPDRRIVREQGGIRPVVTGRPGCAIQIIGAAPAA